MWGGAELAAVVRRESPVVVEPPASGDGRSGCVMWGGLDEFVAGSLQADPVSVSHWRCADMAGEPVLECTDAQRHFAGEIGDGCVLERILLQCLDGRADRSGAGEARWRSERFCVVARDGMDQTADGHSTEVSVQFASQDAGLSKFMRSRVIIDSNARKVPTGGGVDRSV